MPAGGCTRTQRLAGFTLRERRVVSVIIGSLDRHIGPQYFSRIGKREVKAARAQINALARRWIRSGWTRGITQTPEEGLPALIQHPSNAAGGPYPSKAVPPDPWPKPYGVHHVGGPR